MTPLDQKEKNTAANRVKGQHVRKFLLEWGKPPWGRKCVCGRHSEFPSHLGAQQTLLTGDNDLSSDRDCFRGGTCFKGNEETGHPDVFS